MGAYILRAHTRRIGHAFRLSDRMHTLLLWMVLVSASDPALLKAQYTQIEGTDPEYAQGAIEKNDVPHREIAHFIWLIAVPQPGEPKEWEERLNAAVDRHHGSFRVVAASDAEKRRVRSGEIALQK